MATQALQTLLERDRDRLVDFVTWKAGAPLLRFESAEDLVQGVHLEALRSADRFTWQGESAFVGWINRVAERHLAGRRDHWFALKRNCGALLRLTWGADREGSRDDSPLMDSATGPATFAFRREQLVLATRALNLLLPRDRELINWTTHGVSLEAQASRLGISREAAERARSRAVERLRKTFKLVSRSPKVPESGV